MSTTVNLGNVENLRASPYGSLYFIANDKLEGSLDLRFPVNQLIWNGLGESQGIYAADSTASATYNFSEQFATTAEVSYAAGSSDFNRWGMAAELAIEPDEHFSLASSLSYEKASYLFNNSMVQQNSWFFQAGFIPHIAESTDLEAGFSYSNTSFSTTPDSYSLYRLRGGVRQQLKAHFLSAGLSYGGDSSDYDLYGMEASFLWNLGEGLNLFNLVQFDYFSYDAPQSVKKSGQRPRPGSGGRRFNPQSTADSFVSFLWYASLSKSFDL